MAKSSKRKKTSRKPAAQPPASYSRRAAIFLGGAAIVGGVGVFSVNAVQATVAEHDLTRVGTGTPTVVQIHDPQCSLCTALQRETRRALKGVPEDALTYLIANIRNEDGAAFANRHGQPHVTLLLLDGSGQVQEVINGVQDADILRRAFERHIARHAEGS